MLELHRAVEDKVASLAIETSLCIPAAFRAEGVPHNVCASNCGASLGFDSKD